MWLKIEKENHAVRHVELCIIMQKCSYFKQLRHIISCCVISVYSQYLKSIICGQLKCFAESLLLCFRNIPFISQEYWKQNIYGTKSVVVDDLKLDLIQQFSIQTLACILGEGGVADIGPCPPPPLCQCPETSTDIAWTFECHICKSFLTEVMIIADVIHNITRIFALIHYSICQT